MSVLFASDDTISNIIQTNPYLVIIICTKWSQPCLQVLPLVDRIEREYSNCIKIAVADADASPKIVERYLIKTVPAIVASKHGIVTPKIVQNQRIDYSTIRNVILELLDGKSCV